MLKPGGCHLCAGCDEYISLLHCNCLSGWNRCDIHLAFCVMQQEAEAAGCTVVSGLEMFVGQAVEQYELFTKQAAPVTVMRQAVMESLYKH